MNKLNSASMRCLPIGLALFLVTATHATRALASEGVKFNADIRTRYEKDYGVTAKRDRDRIRYRLRGGITGSPSDYLELGARLVSGAASDPQSPHQTLGENFSKKPISVDRAYALFREPQERGRLTTDTWFWIGKNGFPFRSRNELFWDDDVNPEGVALRATYKDVLGSESAAGLTGGWFILESPDDQLTDMPSLGAGEVAVSKNLDGVKTSAAVGFFAFNDPTGNNARLEGVERNLLAVDFEAGLSARPLTLGGSLYLNTSDTPTEGDLAKFDGEDLGLVASLSYGKLKAQHDWLAAAYWARIEKWSVVGRFAQDDWWRFGGNTDDKSQSWTDGSNFQGVELRFAYAMFDKLNLVLRHYLTTEIVGDRDANRVRLDLNMKF